MTRHSKAGLMIAVAVTGVLILRGDWFRDQVRRRIIAEVERASVVVHGDEIRCHGSYKS